MGRLPESWVAPPAVRELREMVRFRWKLSRLQAGLKAQVHQTLGKEGAIPPTASIWWSGGQRWLDELQLADAYTNRIESLRDLLEVYPREITQLDARIHRRLNSDAGYQAIQAIGGVGQVLAAVFVAEIGDVTRVSTTRAGCARGLGSPHATTSPTPKWSGVGSPRWAQRWCGGPRSKRSPAPTVNRAWQ
jgi:transposase